MVLQKKNYWIDHLVCKIPIFFWKYKNLVRFEDFNIRNQGSIYINTSFRLSISLSVLSQLNSLFWIIEARPLIRAQDRSRNSEAITRESCNPSLELFARQSLTISFSANGSQ